MGHLNFTCRVVAPGRVFTRRLCDAMAGIRAPHHRLRVSVGMREDMATWLHFLRDFNGVSFWCTEQLVEAEC